MKKLLQIIKRFLDPTSKRNITKSTTDLINKLNIYGFDTSHIVYYESLIAQTSNPELKYQLQIEYFDKLNELGKDLWLFELDRKAW